VLRQTHKQLELIIGLYSSIDSTESIIRDYKDSRIHLMTVDSETFFETVNEVVAKAKGKYIARMGAEDISHPDRLKCMVEFLEHRPNVGLVGTAFECLDQDGIVYQESFDLDRSNDLRVSFLVTLPFEPSVPLVRRSIYKEIGSYNANSRDSNHDFYWRIAKKHPVGFIRDPLYAKRAQDSKATKPQQISPKRGWSKVLLIGRVDVQKAINHYDKLDDLYDPGNHFYLDQYVYLLASLISVARRKRHYFSAAYITWSAFSVRGIRHLLKDALKNPAVYNHNPHKDRLR
jgi:hypothetical protein